jgi:hypothetical protein
MGTAYLIKQISYFCLIFLNNAFMLMARYIEASFKQNSIKALDPEQVKTGFESDEKIKLNA